MTVPIISNSECYKAYVEAESNSEFHEFNEEVFVDGTNSEPNEVTEEYINSEFYEVPRELVWDRLICISTEGGYGTCAVSCFTVFI